MEIKSVIQIINLSIKMVEAKIIFLKQQFKNPDIKDLEGQLFALRQLKTIILLQL